MKIALGFLQIITNLAMSLEIEWPEQLENFIAEFNFFNLEIFTGAATECAVDTTYYTKFWLMCAAPPVLIVALLFGYLLPAYFNKKTRVLHPDEKKVQRKAARQQFWRLVIFTLFLFYPTVSSTILRTFVCMDVDGTSFLRTDFSVTCDTARHAAHRRMAFVLILIYPVGVPLFFFVMILRYYLQNRLENNGVRTEVGLLYDGYERKYCFFEMLDMAHKLILTSLLALFPYEWQMPFGMFAAALYMAAIMFGKPFIRKADDRLQVLAQAELMLYLLAGHIFNKRVPKDSYIDPVMTVCLISGFIGFLVYVVTTSLKSGKKIMWENKESPASKFILACLVRSKYGREMVRDLNKRGVVEEEPDYGSFGTDLVMDLEAERVKALAARADLVSKWAQSKKLSSKETENTPTNASSFDSEITPLPGRSDWARNMELSSKEPLAGRSDWAKNMELSSKETENTPTNDEGSTMYSENTESENPKERQSSVKLLRQSPRSED